MTIPRILHHIWVGGAPFPEEFAKFRQGWIDLHPDWQFMFWTDDNVPQMVNQAAYYRAKPAAEKADIIALEVMLRYGGIYVDTDMECLKNIEPLLSGETCVLARMTDRLITNGFMASVPGDPFFAECVAGLENHIMKHCSHNVYWKTGPGYMQNIFPRYPHIKVLESHLIYPYEPRTPVEKMIWRTRGATAFPQAYTAHHWAASWVKKRIT